jgi:hypothetical protein
VFLDPPNPALCADAFNPCALVENFSPHAIERLLRDMGAQTEIAALNGQSLVYARIDGADGAKDFDFIVAPRACRTEAPESCIGATIAAFFRVDAPPPQTIAAFNQRYPFAFAGAGPDGRDAFLSRYEIADYGAPRGNLRASIERFAALAARFEAALADAAPTADARGFASDLAARDLNRGAPSDIAIASDFIRLLIADPAAAKNPLP